MIKQFTVYPSSVAVAAYSAEAALAAKAGPQLRRTGNLQFTIRFPFSVFRLEQLMAKDECRENGKWLMVKGAGGMV